MVSATQETVAIAAAVTSSSDADRGSDLSCRFNCSSISYCSLILAQTLIGLSYAASEILLSLRPHFRPHLFTDKTADMICSTAMRAVSLLSSFVTVRLLYRVIGQRQFVSM